MQTEIARRLLAWYRAAARRLPWRGSPDPYAVWVSEIMLQQTRVDTVLPYYQRWMERFPSLQSLAAAGEEEVLRLWEGLGYYSRARNLHKAARQVVEGHGGQLPRDVAGLRRLPGVGAYTAGAIASMAFGADEPTLDGNIRRVLARVFNLELPAKSPEGERRLWGWARENLPEGQAGDYNQAWMDLGASICTPQRPACLVCPLANLCQAHQLGVEVQRPILPEKAPVPQLTVTAAVIARDGCVLIARRPQEGLLGGLWEFPGGKLEAGESLEACLAREIREELGCQVGVGAELGVYHHAYTHFKVTLHAFACQLMAGEPQALQHSALAWAEPARLGDYPMGKIDRRIARQLDGEAG
jgi:A/G-specific adenine glycosylase